MSKEQFIELYIIQFMASWAAVNYSDCCMRGKYNELACGTMIVEARFLAEKTFANLNSLG
jgi:hypothetical protein